MRGTHHESAFSFYESQFEVIRADTAALRDRVYQIRYQVYCVENPYEDQSQNVGGREIDADDDRAAHVLLIHRESGEAVGTARVIFPDPFRERSLPIERILDASAGSQFQRLPLQSTGEVSRFAVSKAFRRRRCEDRYADVGPASGIAPASSAERRIMPFITFGLVRGILGVCLENGLSHITAVMEPALIRLLKRFALDFNPLGGLVEHHGLRQPCVGRVHEMVAEVREQSGLLWPHFSTEISRRQHLRSAPLGSRA